MKLAIFLLFCSSLFARYDPQNEKVLITGVCKNVAPCLPNMIHKIESLGSYFKDYRVVIYENNSTDQTVQLLREWAKRNPRLILFSENLSESELLARTELRGGGGTKPNRMELIAYARNVVLQEVMSPGYDDFKFVITTDMDFREGWYVNSVLTAFSHVKPWDAIFANGITPTNYYWDRFAFRDYDRPFGPELLDKAFWREVWGAKMNLLPNRGLIPVYSAFGGIGIYKREALKGATYSGVANEDLRLFYQMIIDEKLPPKHRYMNLYRTFIKSEEMRPPVIFCPNTKVNGPAVCEHVTLHASMILRGHDRLFIDPTLYCNYSTLEIQ